MVYFALKYLHLIGATVLLGIAAFMLMAHRTGEAVQVAAVARIVVVADFLFTATAVVAQPSKCGDARLRTLLYEPANVMLTRCHGSLALKTWALDIARRSTLRKARVALARRLAVIMFAMLKHGAEFEPA